MKQRPIIFSAPMVRAILDGRKTQTRRILKSSPHSQAERAQHFEGTRWDWLRYDGLRLATFNCPYSQPGDLLWVREKFAMQTCVNGEPPPFSDGRPILRRSDTDFDGWEPLWVQPHYAATDTAPDLCCERENCRQCRDNDYGPHWQSPIFMPRWASRITLEITAVRVERLQDISEEDAIAEGCAPSDGCHISEEHYMDLWCGIHGPDSWDANPWVWVIEFKRANES